MHDLLRALGGYVQALGIDILQVSKDQFISVLIEATQATKEWFCSIRIIFVAYSELNRVRTSTSSYHACVTYKYVQERNGLLIV